MTHSLTIPRRTLLAAAGGLGWLMMVDRDATAADTIAALKLTKADIATPALLVDIEVLEKNLHTMAEHCRTAKSRLRPHAKTHKCPQLAQRQLDAGAVGISCATVAEVEGLATAGITGLLLTSPVVEPTKIARLVKLAQQGHRLTLSVGHPRQVELLGEAASAEKITFDLLVDVDVGDRRTGVAPGQPAVELAQQIARYQPLKIRGVQAYAGHASHVHGFEQRLQASRTALAKALETRDLLNKAGFEATLLSGGSTGTYNIDTSLPNFELQAGSYVFMDVDYRAIGGRESGETYQDFQPSLTILTTVVSAGHPDRVTVDAGTKAIDTTTNYRPESKERPGYLYQRGGDEFGLLTLEPDAKLPKIGDRLEFIAPHCDPTVNLYDCLYVTRGERVIAIWPIVARRG